MTANIRRDATPSPPRTTSRSTSGNGVAFQVQLSESSDDDVPLLNFKLSALTNALLDSETCQQDDACPSRYQDRRNEFSANQIGDENAERQPKSDSSRLHRQSQSPIAIGHGLPELDNTRPMRIVRIRSKDPKVRGSNTPKESKCSPQLLYTSAGRSQIDGSISAKLVTPSPRFYSSKLEGARSESSAFGSQRTGMIDSGVRGSVNGASGVHNIPTATVERLTQSEDAYRRSTSSILRSTKSAGTSILGPARRFKRRSSGGLSPDDQILYASGSGAVGESEHQTERHNKAPRFNGTDQSQSSIVTLNCHDVESSVKKLENPKMVSQTRNDVGNFIDSRSPSKPSNIHQRNPLDLLLGDEKENDQPPAVFGDGKSINVHVDKHVHPGPGHKEKQNGTPGFTASPRKALGILGINNSHRPPSPPKMSVLEMATKAAGAATASSDRKRGYTSQLTTMHTSA